MAPVTRFGIFIHKIFEDFHKWTVANKNNYSEELARIKMREIFSQRLSQYRERYPLHIHKLGYDTVDIYDLYIQEYLDYFLTNKLYTRNIHPEKNFNIITGKYQLNGKIDLFIEPNIVIDFKSGEHETDTDKLVKNMQLNFYSLVTSMPVDFSYIFVKRPIEFRSFRLNKPREKVMAEIINSSRQLLQAKVFPKKEKMCNYCPYRFECKPTTFKLADNEDSLDFDSMDTV